MRAAPAASCRQRRALQGHDYNAAMQELIDHEQLSEALARVGYVDAAAGLHGSLCGALCVAKPEDVPMLALLEPGDQPVPGDAGLRATLLALREQAVAALQDSNMVFALLLPDDDSALVPRVRALAAWCDGFLFGLASHPGLDLHKLSEEAREIIRDFTEFTQAAVGDTDDPNIEEAAYIELVEYVRVGAQLLYMEMHPRPTLDPAQSSQLH